MTAGTGGLMANLVPFTLAETNDKGILRAYIAKANPQIDALQAGAEMLVVFHGPQAYITPSWYASKKEHGRVVPTVVASCMMSLNFIQSRLPALPELRR
jgi:transcriptional regulator